MFPADEILIFTIKAAKVNRDGDTSERGNGQQEAFNLATSRRGGFSVDKTPNERWIQLNRTVSTFYLESLSSSSA